MTCEEATFDAHSEMTIQEWFYIKSLKDTIREEFETICRDITRKPKYPARCMTDVVQGRNKMQSQGFVSSLTTAGQILNVREKYVAMIYACPPPLKKQAIT